MEQESCQTKCIDIFLATENFANFVNTRFGKHFCSMHTSLTSAFYIQKYFTVITTSFNNKWMKRFIVLVVLRICRWGHYLYHLHLQMPEPSKTLLQTQQLLFPFPLDHEEAGVMKVLALIILHANLKSNFRGLAICHSKMKSSHS